MNRFFLKQIQSATKNLSKLANKWKRLPKYAVTWIFGFGFHAFITKMMVEFENHTRLVLIRTSMMWQTILVSLYNFNGKSSLWAEYEYCNNIAMYFSPPRSTQPNSVLHIVDTSACTRWVECVPEVTLVEIINNKSWLLIIEVLHPSCRVIGRPILIKKKWWILFW